MASEIATAVPVSFNVMTEPYGMFMTKLRRALAAASKDGMVVGPKSMVERPVLAKQTAPDQQPVKWIHVELNVKGGAKPKVAIRSDNAYILGFTNREEKWFQLSRTGTKDKLVDKNAVMLGFEGGYTALVGRVDKLTTLDFRRFSTADAAGKLWNHTKNLYDDDETAMLRKDQLKDAVAILCVVVSEAARFTPVYDIISEGWAANSKVPITLDAVNYIKNWGNISKELLNWKKDAYKNDDKYFSKFKGIGIRNGKEALNVVQLVLRIESKPQAWLKYVWGLWGLLVKKLRQEDTIYKKPKSSAIVNPDYI